MSASDLLLSRLKELTHGKRVGILGFAREGQSTYKSLRNFLPELHITIMDAKESEFDFSGDPLVTLHFGNDYLDALTNCDLIFRTPGISLLTMQIQDAISVGKVVTSQTEIFFSLFGKQVIAVTGTKGKSTTCSVIHQVLNALGKEAIFIGNIGSSAFDCVDKIGSKTIIVYETSSYQCEGLRHNPHVGVFLNLFKDHLDYHKTQEIYAEAKRQLFLNQLSTDLCIYNALDEQVMTQVAGLRAQKIGFSLEKTPYSRVFTMDDWICLEKESEIVKIVRASDIPLLGTHNLLNIMPAIVIADYLQLDLNKLSQALALVKPVEKRLEVIAQVDGVKFIDDALATIPEATIAGLSALGNDVQTLIVGGHDRGQDFSALAHAVAFSRVKNLICFPKTGYKIAKLVESFTDKIEIFSATSMEQAVSIAKKHTQKGKTVLLSTASPSFGLFNDYRDRSEQYKRAIEAGS